MTSVWRSWLLLIILKSRNVVPDSISSFPLVTKVQISRFILKILLVHREMVRAHFSVFSYIQRFESSDLTAKHLMLNLFTRILKSNRQTINKSMHQKRKKVNDTVVTISQETLVTKWCMKTSSLPFWLHTERLTGEMTRKNSCVLQLGSWFDKSGGKSSPPP